MWSFGGYATYIRSSSGISSLVLAALVFFPWNAVEPVHGWWLAGQAFISLVAGQFVGAALLALYHRLFDVKDV